MKPRKLFFYPMTLHFNMTLNDAQLWINVQMSFDAGVNVWWLLWMHHDMTLTLTFREHQRVTRTGWQGGEVTAWQETQLWQRAGHRIRIQQRQSPWTTTRKQHNWHCAPQVPCQCPGPQCLACVCDHDWFGNIYNQKTWLIASCPAPTTTPTLP